MQARTVTQIGNSTDFVSVIENIFGLSRDNGGLDKTNPLQLLLTFVVSCGMDTCSPTAAASFAQCALSTATVQDIQEF